MAWPGRVRSRRVAAPQSLSSTARASGEPAPVILPSVQLDISGPDGWNFSVRVPDGGAAQIGGSPGRLPLILRPRVMPAGLMLEIARADGKPLKDQGSRAQPMVLLLDRNVTVQLWQPYPFSVRWAGGEPAAK